jgi:predicted esterase
VACQPQHAPRPAVRATGDVALLGEDVRALVVALHGYAGGGAEMVATLRAAAGNGMPALVFGPDGPLASRLARPDAGRAWYPVTSQVSAMRSRAAPLAAELIRRIDLLRAIFDVPRRCCCLLAFSQGTTVASAVLEEDPDWGRCVLVSGRITGPVAGTRGEVPEVLAVAGGADRFAPPEVVRADLGASALGPRSRLVVLPHLSHEFTREVAGLALSFATAPVQDGVPRDPVVRAV